MNEKELNEIKDIVDNLDKKVNKDDAVVQFSTYGGGEDESKVQANQKGYLRLGIEFLKAAFAPEVNKDKHIIDVNINYLISNDSEINFDWLERREDIQPRPKPYKAGGLKDAIALIIFATALLVIITLMGLGIMYLFS